MGRRSEPFAPGRPRHADVVVAAGFVVATVAILVTGTLRGWLELGGDAGGAWWAVCTVLTAVTLAWRRRRPLVPVVAVHLAFWTTDGPAAPPLALVLGVAWCVVLASVVLHGSRTTLVQAGLAGASITVFGVVALEETFLWGDAAGIAVPVAVGAAERWIRVRRRRRELAARRREWDDERRAVEQERVRMARELHDVVAHHVSGIVVSGGAALRILDRDPDTVRDTLRTIAESAGRTTEAMHRMITNGEDGADVAPGGAQPGLRDLHELVERFTGTGCSVEFHPSGDLGAVPPDAGLSVYRIVQECLTNSLKHAGPVAVTVRLHRDADHLVVRVDDAGPGADVPLAPLHGTGQGLVGMGERVAIFDGTLAYGPRLGGGWSVRASLPLGRPATG